MTIFGESKTAGPAIRKMSAEEKRASLDACRANLSFHQTMGDSDGAKAAQDHINQLEESIEKDKNGDSSSDTEQEKK